jgi:hypothetical protein
LNPGTIATCNNASAVAQLRFNRQARNNDHFRRRVRGSVFGFWAWHSPWAGKLTKAEIDCYLAIIQKRLLPAEEVKAFTSPVRSWTEADDGCPVYMFNLIHFLPQFRTFPGAPGFRKHLRKPTSIMWPWLRHAAYPIEGRAENRLEPGRPAGGNVRLSER